MAEKTAAGIIEEDQNPDQLDPHIKEVVDHLEELALTGEDDPNVPPFDLEDPRTIDDDQKHFQRLIKRLDNDVE